MIQSLLRRTPLAAFILTAAAGLNGCSLVLSSATDDLGKNLSQAMLNHNDPETVAEAIPAYLLLSEALLIKQADNPAALLSTAKLYAAYLTLLADNGERAQRLSDKALHYALQAVCMDDDTLCALQTQPFADFETAISAQSADNIDALYTLATVWAGWIQAHKSDWQAVAQLAQVKRLLSHVLQLNPHYKNGEPQAYLGVLASLVPPALGGKPDEAKQYFEQAMQLAGEQQLMIPVLYAKHYARAVFDRELHDRLLNAVVAAKTDAPNLSLTNTLAQKQAKALLKSANDYF